MLTPLDIHNKEFHKGFRGYSEVEVDEFLDQVVRDFEEVLRENADRKARIEELEAKVGQYRAMEETLNNTLIVAQQAADEVRASAHKEADLIVERAKFDAAKMGDDALQKTRGAQLEYEGVRKQVQVFKIRMKALVKSYMDILEGTEEDIEATKVV
ncbi:MAG: DivIVA domain-containing protein [Bacillota bacterium]|nr:DivIVA domain-containing protein [Bacillota bacterium]